MTKILFVLIILSSPTAFSDETKGHHSHNEQMGGMQMGDMKMGHPEKTEKPSVPEMEMRHKVIPGGEGMQDMPLIKPKRIYTVSGEEDFSSIMGYGRDDGMVGMMDLMMVEGSQMEGMEMEPMHSHGTNSDLDPLAPENLAQFSKKSQMSGHHQDMAMNKMNMDEKSLSVKAEIQPNPPVVGENKILFSISSPGTGKRIPQAKLKAKVEMTSMDMGSEEPTIKELPDGQYEVKATFGMMGPWRVRIEGSTPEKSGGGKVLTNLIFDAGSKKPWVQQQ